MVTSPKRRGRLSGPVPALARATAFALAAAVLCPQAQAQDLDLVQLRSSAAAETPLASDDLPVLFDARERLARPDLALVPRIRIVTTVDFPPFNFLDQTGRLTGFHIDIAREVCAELKVEAKCQIQAMPFADLQPALEKGAADMVLAGIAVTPDLRQKFSFSRPYLLLPARFAVNRAGGAAGAGLQARDVAAGAEAQPRAATALAGRSVGVVAATVHEAMLKSFFPTLQARPFETPEAMLEALKQGSVDAVFGDGLRLPFWVASEASASCCTLFDGPYMSPHFLGEGLSAMFRPGDATLPVAFDSAVAALSRNGRLQEIYRRYFPNGLY